MMNSNHSSVKVSILLMVVLCCCGFEGISLEDVETAIVKQEYEQAKGMTVQLLSSGLEGRDRYEAFYYAALCDLWLGRHAEARETFTELIGKEVDVTLRDKAYLGLFEGYYLGRYYGQALQTAKDLLKISPRSEFLSLIHLKVARAHLKLAQWEEARAVLEKITTRFPESLEAHLANQLLNEEQHFAVQVGAFIDRKRAEDLTVELQQKGEYAYIVETLDYEGRTFYRVRVGQLTLLDDAQKLKTKLSKAGYPTQIYP